MFPLQSLLKTAHKTNSGSSTPSTPTLALNETTIDPDSELAHALQSLLEQEALLETFVQDATAKRMFEDAQTLRENLTEIRGEIDRIFVPNSPVGRRREEPLLRASLVPP